jgi:hypothetical protein
VHGTVVRFQGRVYQPAGESTSVGTLRASWLAAHAHPGNPGPAVGYRDRWGSPVYTARCWLVGQAAGDDKLVPRATHAAADALVADLGYGSAGPLERVAIYRVLSCWQAVGVLEAKACRWGAHTRERLTVERCLALADRRLTAAVKLLATVRRVPVEELLGRVQRVSIEGFRPCPQRRTPLNRGPTVHPRRGTSRHTDQVPEKQRGFHHDSAGCTPGCTSPTVLGTHRDQTTTLQDPNLELLACAWPNLPRHIRALPY